MSTIYQILHAQKGVSYKEEKIKEHSLLRTKPKIDKHAGSLAGLSRIYGDVDLQVQDRIIDILVEIGARYKLPYRDIAHLLLICKVESGFNPDAAAGTTSAAGLAQYTEDTIEEAAKPHVSKKRLGFILDLSDNYVFDAERGAYGVVLSFMLAKERAIKFFNTEYEKHLYLFHHEGWYFKPTKAHMTEPSTKEVLQIINKKILPYLDTLEKLLSNKTNVSFKLLTKDGNPYPDQPYLAILSSVDKASKNLPAVQGNVQMGTEFVFEKTDAQGKTKSLSTAGLSEVLFIILNKDYKNLLKISSCNNSNMPTVTKGEGISSIAKMHDMTTKDVGKINHIANGRQLNPDQKLVLHTGEYLWRRPPIGLVADYLRKVLNMNTAAASAIVEHKRSHIVLPKGNEAQKHDGKINVIVIRGGATSEQITEKKKETDIPHKTAEKNITKIIKKEPLIVGKPLKDGLLFPFLIRPTESYHTGARRFNSNRGTRRHAGCDLYAPVGTEIRAMEDGVILQCYSFYWQTDAIEVDHGDFIVRYGEVAPRSKEEQIELRGKPIKRGEILGKVGQLIKLNGVKHKDTMLHLEMYNSNVSPNKQPLTNKKLIPFERRSDLIDPTATLDKCVIS